MTSMPSPAVAYVRVRAHTLALIEGLTAEDCQIQSMPDASPVKWHLAHTTWFFETFVLAAAWPEYLPVDPAYRALFNSYYVGIGARAPRAERGLMSRPTLAEVLAYRAEIDARISAGFRARCFDPAQVATLELGCHHEQQHQELILTDLKHHLSRNPLYPAYRAQPELTAGGDTALDWIGFEAGVRDVGHGRTTRFSFDNETPRHRVFAEAFELASRLVSNADYQRFIDDSGYQRPELWLSDGWDAVHAGGWQAPLYWFDDGSHYTLAGRLARVADAPVCHVSYYEADAYARWAAARLPTEAEWEIAASGSTALRQMQDCCWQWTASAYLPYPGFQPAAGAVGEYNGKFMINQMVLRGGSCATPAGHLRPTYRNFFPPSARWQFSGIRLARSRR
ncbi:ergothioneine biosynthesis protein EgtB [Nevskia sp.]|uniref:ergothioneine biosynthesis protein EgtB n=1 Tax=Nevskia sp. TaxID=1929292 RepID=UPI002600A1B1|nr:ergothioneine biosynthesis protein EgtB [Nevskia sp.]